MNYIIEIPASGYKFALVEPDQLKIMGLPPVTLFEKARDAVSDLATNFAAIRADVNLSDLGKSTKCDDLATRCWATLIASYVSLAAFQKSTDLLEQAMIAVPKLDPGATAVATEDVEARQWFRSQSDRQRMSVLVGLQDDAANGARFSRLQVALLRSPIPLPDSETDLMAKIWKQTCQAKDPATALAVATQRNASEWGASAMGHLRGALQGLTLWMAPKIALFIASDKTRTDAAPLMGFTPLEMADAARQLEPTHWTRRAA